MDTCQINNNLYVIRNKFSDSGIIYRNNYPELYPEDQRFPTEKDFGLEADGFCTACYLGYVMHYRIISDHLFLEGIDILSKNPPPSVNDISPFQIPKGFGFWSYNGLNIPLKVTGGLLLDIIPLKMATSIRLWQFSFRKSIKRIGLRFLKGLCIVGYQYIPTRFRRGKILSFNTHLSKESVNHHLTIIKRKVRS
jgi:hypothetical protein